MSVASLGLVKNGFDNPLVSLSPQAVVAGGNGNFQEALTIAQGYATQDGTQNPSAPTRYEFYTTSSAGGGLNPHSLQLYGYYDPRVSGTATIQEHIEVKIVPTATPVLGIPPDTTSCVQTNLSRPFNWVGPWIGNFTGTGVAQVVPVANIPQGSAIRLYLMGGDPACFVAGVAPAVANSIQIGVSFTATGTAGAIYGYEVLIG